MKALGAVVLLLSFSAAQAADKDDAKVKAARITVRNLDIAAKVYYVKNGFVLAKLEDLVNGANGQKPYIEGGEKALLDPWGKQYQYDSNGPKNDGKTPDIWTETPDKKVIGNWPEGKK
jgi:hypothetical protein